MSVSRNNEKIQKNDTDEFVEVISITHWNKKLFSFSVTRPKSLRFSAGEFVMLGLPNADGREILRAYSIASPTWSDSLTFYSINIENGPLTSMLSKIRPADKIILKRKTTGTLVLDALKPGKRLFLFSTGTGFAPFASIIREPDVYDRFESIILTHTCREISDLAFSQMTLKQVKNDSLISTSDIESLIYYPTLTRELGCENIRSGRITDLLTSGDFFSDLQVPRLSKSLDRVMICGSQSFNFQMRDILKGFDFEEGSLNNPGDFVLEKAFVGS